VIGGRMKFGIAFANIGPMTYPEGAIGQSAEAGGFESLWTVEHVLVPADYASPYPYSPTGKMPGPDDSDIPDPLIWLTYVAASTSTIRLGTGILILPQRNPIVVAKEIATLDRLSGGRVELGVGVGWLEEEFDALGIPFADRGLRTDDNIAVLRALWAEGPASHESQYTTFSNAYSRPRPTQSSIPITVGGHSKAAARRAGRIGDGFFPGKGSHEELAELIDVMRATAKEHGRDPDAIEVTAGGDGAIGSGALDEVKALADLGVSRVIIPPLAFDPEGQREAFGRYGDEVISRS
jgi:probable F420-dependent oxidoreductase